MDKYRGVRMRVKENPDYTVFLTESDINSLILDKPISFWIGSDENDRKDLTFILQKE